MEMEEGVKEEKKHFFFGQAFLSKERLLVKSFLLMAYGTKKSQ